MTKLEDSLKKCAIDTQRAFSKNNKDIGRTTLTEMEIDTGDNLPVAQNPYTLPLKHHRMGTKRNRNARKSWSNRKKPVSLGITCDSGSKEISARRTSEKTVVHGLPKG